MGLVNRLEHAALLCALLLAAGCAHEVIALDPEPSAFTPPDPPLAMTVAVREGSFDNSRLSAPGILDFFAAELREAKLFQGVIHPTEAGLRPIWELEISASDGGSEPNSNFWKSFVSNALPPLMFVIYLQNDYHLELQALLLRDRHLIGTYRADTGIRHRYQAYANKAQMEAEGLDRLARSATRRILAEIAADAAQIARENER